MLTFLAGLAIGALVTLAALEAWRHFQAKRAVNRQLDEMRDLGYRVGRAGLPPDFYKESLGEKVDVVDELAIMQGWDRSWEEFKARPTS